MPDVIAASRQYNNDLVVLGIDVDEDPATVQAFAASRNIPYPVLLDSGAVGRMYRLTGFPHHVFIDRQGNISGVVHGEMNAGEMDSEILRAIGK